jgi:hypothetical protein
MLLTTKARDRVLEPVEKMEKDEQQWETAEGAKWTSHAARASFDLEETLKIGGATGELRVVVAFAGDEAEFRFGSKHLKTLEPEWAQ